MSRTVEDPAALHLLGRTIAEWQQLRSGKVAKNPLGRKRMKNEATLAAMPVTDAFKLLATQESRLLEIEDETLRVAEACRAAGQDESSVRVAVGDIFQRSILNESIVGPWYGNTGIVATAAALQVTFTYMAMIAHVDELDLQ